MPYLMLWHGRVNPDEELSTWGENGPVFGPFPFFQMTYGIEIKFAKEDGHRLSVVHGLVYYDGMYYGDWSFFDELDRGHRSRLIPFDPHKALVPNETD
jgi:hypothetical protein